MAVLWTVSFFVLCKRHAHVSCLYKASVADDSAFMVSDTCPSKIANLLSKNLEKCNQWLIDNKLSLHKGKTELLLFGTKRKIKQHYDF